eukprot:5729323-Ditylum_brightwellii.AAC.1
MDIAKKQGEEEAHMIDTNINDAILDGPSAMQKFVKIAVREPVFQSGQFMLDALRPVTDVSSQMSKHKKNFIKDMMEQLWYKSKYVINGKCWRKT